MAIIVDERDSNRYYEEDGMIFQDTFNKREICTIICHDSYRMSGRFTPTHSPTLVWQVPTLLDKVEEIDFRETASISSASSF